MDAQLSCLGRNRLNKLRFGKKSFVFFSSAAVYKIQFQVTLVITHSDCFFCKRRLCSRYHEKQNTQSCNFCMQEIFYADSPPQEQLVTSLPVVIIFLHSNNTQNDRGCDQGNCNWNNTEENSWQNVIFRIDNIKIVIRPRIINILICLNQR